MFAWARIGASRTPYAQILNLILVYMHHEALASDYLKASALRRHLCRMYVILCISGSLLVLAACDRLNVRLV